MNSPASRGVVGIMNALLASAIPFFLMAAPAFSDIDPRKILDGVYEQDTSRDTTMRAVFNIFDGDGHKTTKKFMLFRMGSPGDSKTLVRFTDPAEIRGVTLLSYNHKGDSDRQWLYIPATQRTALQKRDSHRFNETRLNDANRYLWLFRHRKRRMPLDCNRLCGTTVRQWQGIDRARRRNPRQHTHALQELIVKGSLL